MNDKLQLTVSRTFLETALDGGREGEVMTLGPEGLELILVRNGMEKDLRQAFRSGVSRYSYWESFTPVPIPLWIFFFTPPLEAFDVFLDPGLVKREVVQAFLEMPDGECSRLQVFLTDRCEPCEKLDLMLDERVVPPLKKTLQKHLVNAYGRQDFSRSVQTVRRFNVSALWGFGMAFPRPMGKNA